MKRVFQKVVLSLIVGVCLFAAGCHGLEKDHACPPSVMIDGEIYCDWSVEPVIDTSAVAENQIIGYITSIVALNAMPEKNNEANYPNAANAAYARWVDEKYGEVYVIQYGYGWHILLPKVLD